MANAQFIIHYYTHRFFTFFTLFFSLFHITMAGGKVAARKRKRKNTGVQKENIITDGQQNTPLTRSQCQTGKKNITRKTLVNINVVLIYT